MSTPQTTLIIRLHRDAAGQLRGFVERPRTGAKEPFGGLADIANAITRLLTPEHFRSEGEQAGR